jgi:DNA-binding HxlR family transcriptional regulator
MKKLESLAIIKALADNSRLMIMDALVKNPAYVEELSQRFELAPSTISFHLKKLENAGLVYHVKQQYYVVYYANQALLERRLADLITVSTTEQSDQEQRMGQYRQKVIRTFFQNGKLPKLPAQYKKRLIVLEEIARLFTEQESYTEKQVNATITPYHDDYCLVRREMVDAGIMARKKGKYWLTKSTAESDGSLPQTCLRSRKEKTMDRRKALKLAYKQTRQPAGVYKIENRANGKIFIDSSTNLKSIFNRHCFQLKIGSHRDAAMQRDWDKYGSDNFVFEELERLKPDDDPLADGPQKLATLKKSWIKKLQPFGKKGYNR